MTKYECYNIGVKYLQGKYGIKRGGLLDSFYFKIKHLSTKEYRKAIDNATDDDYQTTFNQLPDDAPMEDQVVVLLLGQYYYGLEPRKELWRLLTTLKVIEM